MVSARLCVGALVSLGLAGAFGFSEHSRIETSLVQAQHECVTYLNLPKHRLYQYLVYNYSNDAKTKLMIRCVGLILQWWNSEGVLNEHVIEQYFLPDAGDTTYRERTAVCVETKAPEGDALCSRAFETFQCYLQQYGELIHCPKVVPLSDERLAETMHFCLDVLSLPLSYFENCTSSAELFLATDQSRCLLRCFVIRAGLYSDQHGPFAERFRLQFGPLKADVFDNDLEGDYCVTRLRREGYDECSLAARSLYECYYFADTLLPTFERIIPILQLVMLSTLDDSSEEEGIDTSYCSTNKIKQCE
ncbi:general odorant-binding protein 45-like [Anopheles marshallii]|uniref:general odorant-binding protein 45-like n=1 Tax=Anopheles marshallii TaxID=1521116 RepID=UPI00237BA4FA|nr:general odorant-binding protein 45-like [Anopheles marshallii]